MLNFMIYINDLMIFHMVARPLRLETEFINLGPGNGSLRQCPRVLSCISKYRGASIPAAKPHF